MQENFDKNLLERLRDEKLSPTPRWHYSLANFAIWTLGSISFVVGSVSFALIIHLLKNNDWAIYEEVGDGLWRFIITTLPLFWIILLILFVWAMFYNLRHTKTGYRYSVPAMLSLCLLLSFGTGIVLHQFSLGQFIDDVLGEQAPYYREIMNPMVSFWDSPAQGRLIGVISSSTDPHTFVVIDFRDKEWRVRCGACAQDRQNPIAVSRPIRLMGEILDENTFSAVKIFPVGSGRGLFRKRGFGIGHTMMAQPYMQFEQSR